MKFLYIKEKIQKNSLNKEFNPLYIYNAPLYDNFYNYKLYSDYMLNFLYLQYTPYILNKKKDFYKLNTNSYIKKFFNNFVRHGLKIAYVNSIFYATRLLFNTSLPTFDKSIIKNYSQYNTFIYNLNNYNWLRSFLSLSLWSYTWIDYIFKYTIVRKKSKAGHKKIKNKIKINYIPPIKRPLLLNYFFKNIIKDQSFNKCRHRVSSVILDTFLNYKSSRLYRLKIFIYKKHIQKLKHK